MRSDRSRRVRGMRFVGRYAEALTLKLSHDVVGASTRTDRRPDTPTLHGRVQVKWSRSGGLAGTGVAACRSPRLGAWREGREPGQGTGEKAGNGNGEGGIGYRCPADTIARAVGARTVAWANASSHKVGLRPRRPRVICEGWRAGKDQDESPEPSQFHFPFRCSGLPSLETKPRSVRSEDAQGEID